HRLARRSGDCRVGDREWLHPLLRCVDTEFRSLCRRPVCCPEKSVPRVRSRPAFSNESLPHRIFRVAVGGRNCWNTARTPGSWRTECEGPCTRRCHVRLMVCGSSVVATNATRCNHSVLFHRPHGSSHIRMFLNGTPDSCLVSLSRHASVYCVDRRSHLAALMFCLVRPMQRSTRINSTQLNAYKINS